MERFFAIALLPVLQSVSDKVAITHMRQGCNHAHAGFCNWVFCNRSTSAVCNHTVIALYLFFCNCFFAIAVTCCFLQLFFSSIHTAIIVLATTFFCNRITLVVATTL
jgi:hypothetical protein